MQTQIETEAILNRKTKISFLFIVIVLMVLIFLYSVLNTILSERRVPSNHSTIHDRSFRGSIISADGYTLSRSEKSYQAIIRGASIVPEKKALFIKLFSIYSAIDEANIEKRFLNRKGKEIQGNIIISDTISTSTAMRLKSLAYKLRKLGVFRAIKSRSGMQLVYGLDIIENGENRSYPLADILSPTLGYVADKRVGRYTHPIGKKGLERAYNKHITSKKHGYFRGKRDVLGAVIHDKYVEDNPRVDGLDLHLNIPLALQRRIELMADQMRLSIDAEEILVAVMESKTGKVLSFATTKRYNPASIQKKDIASLVPKFTEYPYEAGSVLKPLSIAIALEHDKITPQTRFNTDYKRFPITAKQYVRDDEHFKSMSTTDIIVHSSNIGTSQISWKLTGEEYRQGLLNFGIAHKTGIDLSRDLPGTLKPVRVLNHKMHRANSAFGYGMMVTFTQMLKAYSAFNNEGLAMTPRLVNYLESATGKQYKLPPKIGNKQAISKKTASDIHDMLLEVVKRGTGVKAQYKGLEVGGKTGTAHIAKNGRYVKEYHSSFYGFANDTAGNKYTIGTLVIRAKRKYRYFASKSAVPTFRRTLDILVELDYLTPEGNITVLPKIKMPKKPKIKIQDLNTTAIEEIQVETKSKLEREIEEDINKERNKEIKKQIKTIRPHIPEPVYKPVYEPLIKVKPSPKPQYIYPKQHIEKKIIPKEAPIIQRPPKREIIRKIEEPKQAKKNYKSFEDMF
ncbi:Cell division protein FtsI [Peptidoglycan synthetase] [hydrothermal vent metagenome]|uniref:Cell division protein FtsI [Peptidoglycan synthetase] n=1 Tax=hydrothermal vent metagenome TaxID=652676 RepID=A0A1W1BZD7_9ZZZZ